jgi:hypothetical protein
MRAFVEKAFNITVEGAVDTNKKVSFAKKPVTAVNGKEPAKMQAQISSYFLDKMIIQQTKKRV